MDTHETQLDRNIREVKNKLIHMAAVAERMIEQAIKELVDRNEQYVADIQPEEEELNRLQLEIDEQVISVLATKQPVAVDLRFIMAATRINSDLERIGDLVINITREVRVLIQQPPLKPLIDIPRMAQLASKMACDSVEAFIKGDPKLAQAVIMMDDEVDALKNQVLRELLTYMMSDPKTIERALAIILIARHLERIGDHATNIAEDVIYMIQGRDVRHPRLQGLDRK
ncbi:MAG: phosphate signaling complex protein PhoU [Planctomycetes bacterium]|nr:phosphate signaling complex protein PhoU [Planctomycetota bacterium]